jgi:hypothetical protein
LQATHGDAGFTVLAFPAAANGEFGNQEPGSNADVKEFVKRFGVTFPMFAKIDVNGATQHPVYKALTKVFPGKITWNFGSAFLVDRYPALFLLSPSFFLLLLVRFILFPLMLDQDYNSKYQDSTLPHMHAH